MPARTEGLVVRVDAKRCHVEVDGAIHLLSPRGKLFPARRRLKNPVAVGDRVVVELDGEGGGSIEEVRPRHSRLARASAGEGTHEQVLVANVDLVLVVASIRQPTFRAELVDRILAGTEREEVKACLVINKIDLDPTDGTEDSSHWREFYGKLGYDTVAASTQTGAGIDELRTRLAKRIAVFCGMSGVGKSSLLNAIEPGLGLAVGTVSERGAREGRHTTTHSSLLQLSNGGHVVDTPGIRNFGLWGLQPTEVAWLFPEMRESLGECAFDDCSHTHEPRCQVKEAVESGTIPSSRYDAYLDLLADSRGGDL